MTATALDRRGMDVSEGDRVRILGITPRDDGVIRIVSHLIQNIFQTVSGIRKIYYAHISSLLVQLVEQI